MITYDDSRMLSKAVSRQGANAQEIKSLLPRLGGAKDSVLVLDETKTQGWISLHADRKMLRDIAAVIKKKKSFDTLLVLGIGGSDLGARALHQALAPKKKKLVFAGANTDPDELADIMSQIDLKSTCINIISKSGDTLEPMATFFHVLERLEKTVGKDNANRHIVATTDPERSALRDLAKERGWTTLAIPQNVGGRFSALTAVGLFPLGFAGADIKGLLRGAGKQFAAFKKQGVVENSACRFAALHYLAYTKRKQHIHVLMPYAAKLRDFAFWYRQLWAESLGKKENRSKKDVHVGPTPVAALGATDQHSQIQLYNEGPYDKTVTFIEVARFENALKTPSAIASIPSLAYAANTTFENIIHAEREATSRALTKNRRANGTLYMSRVDAENMGGLLMFFQLACATLGELFDIDAYNQPGVEAGKKAIRVILKSS